MNFLTKYGIIIICILTLISLFISLANFLNKYNSSYNLNNCIFVNNDICISSFSMAILSIIFSFISSIIIIVYLIHTKNGHHKNDFFNKGPKVILIILLILAFCTQLISNVLGVQEKSLPSIDPLQTNLPLFCSSTILLFINIILLLAMFILSQKKH
jgi:hypothetical protein